MKIDLSKYLIQGKIQVANRDEGGLFEWRKKRMDKTRTKKDQSGKKE